jgi:urea transport system substrate-binding protein
MAISERSVVDATLLAIEEVSERGVLGRPVEAVVEDGESDAPTFAARAEKLITTDKVCAVFGCWTSASRKTVLPVLAKHDHLLFYPLQYEGLEQSPNVVYTGAAPNQQIIPAVKWCVTTLKKKRFFLVGSDYVFPRAANAIIRDQAAGLGAEVVGEEYLSLGDSVVAGVVAKIVAARPDAILNTINGDSNVAFFRALRAAGVTPEKSPTISFSITEEELGSLSTKDLAGDYAAWSYFQTIKRPQNQEFVKRFQAKYGKQRVISDPMEAAYFGVHLWARAVQAAGTPDDVAAVRRAVGGQEFDAPEGLVRIDADRPGDSPHDQVGANRTSDARGPVRRRLRPRPADRAGAVSGDPPAGGVGGVPPGPPPEMGRALGQPRQTEPVMTRTPTGVPGEARGVLARVPRETPGGAVEAAFGRLLRRARNTCRSRASSGSHAAASTNSPTTAGCPRGRLGRQRRHRHPGEVGWLPHRQTRRRGGAASRLSSGNPA